MTSRLITGVAAKLPGDYKKQPTAKRPGQRDKSAAFGMLWARFHQDMEQPVAQYQFCPTRKWRCDWAFVESRLIVEIEGGLWTGGGHSRGSGVKRDIERSNWMAANDWRLLRFTTNELQERPVQLIEDVAAVLEKLTNQK